MELVIRPTFFLVTLIGDAFHPIVRTMVLHRRLPFTDKQLIALHEKGMNDREKAEKLGASSEVVFYHRNKLGLKANRTHQDPPVRH